MRLILALVIILAGLVTTFQRVPEAVVAQSITICQRSVHLALDGVETKKELYRDIATSEVWYRAYVDGILQINRLADINEITLCVAGEESQVFDATETRVRTAYAWLKDHAADYRTEANTVWDSRSEAAQDSVVKQIILDLAQVYDNMADLLKVLQYDVP